VSAAPVTGSRHRAWRWVGGSLCLLFIAVVLLALFWDWNWFRPLVEARLSAALGRAVSIERLVVHPGRVTQVSLYGIEATNPAGFDGPQSATIQRVSVTLEAETWLRSRRIVVPLIELDHPDIVYVQDKAGKSNWDLATSSDSSPGPEIGNLQINAGVVHLHMDNQQADATMNIATQGDTVVIDGKGTYARQPIVVKASGGALLALRDAATPYPVDLQLDNGPTRITLKGHISDPLALKGADLNLVLAGPNMELLLPLTGIATPKTPPYKISGRLDFENGRIKFTNMTGQVGSSDLNGDLEINPAGQRPTLTANLISHRVDMEDLGGFVGSTPGRTTTPGQTPNRSRT
jgi:uncharacterized protein involved in outer membrane biogenesis